VNASAAPAAVSTSDAVVRAVGDESAAAWDEFVTGAAGASIYHRYAWRTVVANVFARDTHYLAAFDGSRVAGVLPLVRLKSRLFGDFLISLPYLNYGGVIAEAQAHATLLVEHACALAERLGVQHLELRHRSNAFGTLAVRTDKITMVLRLPPTAEALWKQVGNKVRGQINQARRAEASCVLGGAELLSEFYAVFAENMRDLGTPVYPPKFFRAIIEAIPDAITVMVVRLAGRAVASGFLIDDGRSVQIPWASSLRRFNSAQVNMLLYWHAVEFACQRGRAQFDFGRCTLDSGTYAFKKKWGAEPEQLYWHYWVRDGGEPPRLNPSNPKFALAIALWQRLPLAVANWLGPRLVGSLP